MKVSVHKAISFNRWIFKKINVDFKMKKMPRKWRGLTGQCPWNILGTRSGSQPSDVWRNRKWSTLRQWRRANGGLLTSLPWVRLLDERFSFSTFTIYIASLSLPPNFRQDWKNQVWTQWDWRWLWDGRWEWSNGVDSLLGKVHERRCSHCKSSMNLYSAIVMS